MYYASCSTGSATKACSTKVSRMPAAVMSLPKVGGFRVPRIDRIWGIWGSYYSIPKAIFYLLKGQSRFLGTLRNMTDPLQKDPYEGIAREPRVL